MIFKMPCYQVKYCDKNHWEEISEITVLKKLQETYTQVTPVLQEMIEGKQIKTSDAVYRIKGYVNPYFS